MVTILFLFGFFSLSGSAFFYRWGDIKSMRVLAITSIILELWVSCSFGSAVSLSSSFSSLNVTECFLGLTHLYLPLILVVDNLSCSFISILTVALLLCFSLLSEYFEYDASGFNITLLSSMFSQLAVVFFMTFDLISMLALWEWISVVSFFLIRYWSMRVTTIKAGLKVFTISQFGDVFFLLGSCLIISTFGASDMFSIYNLSFVFGNYFLNVMSLNVSLVSIVSVSFIFAMLLKSAQFVFYPWLLDAMEAPVPISAQLHSSTLVIIGFYSALRSWPIISMWPPMQPTLTTIGSITAVIASVLGFFQKDGKRLLACSTAGQLGYVVVGLGLGLVDEAVLLLVFCCCNKAFTFVWFGSLMERSNGLSDFRLLGNSHTLFCERAGMLIAAANSTIAPGAFVWHTKSLLSRGVISKDPITAIFGLEFLSLTWFLSLLYMSKLIIFLFVSTNTRVTLSGQQNFFRYNHYGEKRSPLIPIVSTLIMVILWGFSYFGTTSSTQLSGSIDYAIDFYVSV